MISFALRNLFSRPMRSLLALLGLTVAIAGMVGLFSVAAGLSMMVDKAFGRVSGLVAMQHGALVPLFSRLPVTWVEEIARMPGVHEARGEVWSRIQTMDGKIVFNPPRVLCGVDLARTLHLRRSVYRDDVVTGRFLTPEDAGTFACTISRQVAKELDKKIGDTIRVDGYNAHVVGIYDSGSLLLDMALVMHDQDVRTIARFDDRTISSMYIEPEDGAPTNLLIEEIRDKFRGRAAERETETEQSKAPNQLVDLAKSFVKTLTPTSLDGAPTEDESGSATEDGIEVRTARDWGNRLMEFNADLDIFLWLMTLIGLVIALLSILNTMLMSVSERMVEFGVLKANGWTRWNILALITLESAALGLCGGVLGCLIGWAGTVILNTVYETKVHLYASPGVLGFSLAFAVLLGILGGLYPAWWAVRMSPMDAIRRG